MKKIFLLILCLFCFGCSKTEKNITKSGLNHRLRKIKELAERLQKHQQKNKVD